MSDSLRSHVAYQAPPSTEFSRQEYWSGLPFPSPGDLLDPGIEPRTPTLQADALLSEPPGTPCLTPAAAAKSLQSCPTLCNPIDGSPPGSPIPGELSRKNTGVGCHFHLQGIFLTQGSNPVLPHCRQTLYCLSHQGSLKNSP